MRTTLFALSILAAFCVVPAVAQDRLPQITVSGSGQVEAPPDLASFTAGVQSEAVRAADALSATSASMQEVLSALQASGIEPEDMQTSELGVTPIWSDGAEGQPRVRGYVASNIVMVRVRDITRLGAVIDAAGAAGANRLDGISFEVSAPRAHQDEARRLAVADARAKAEVLAKAAGVTLGAVLSIHENGGRGPTPMFARAEMAMDAPIAEGVVALGADVEIVYAIE